MNRGDIVQLDCDTRCNFMITADSDFSSYRSGGGLFHYYGGHYRYFPARIVVPHANNWNITIDLGGGRANIRYNLSIIRK